ncbi:MAG TPA: toxin-antitoxin system YwqK family antitoxin [Flavobacterium sp.]|jgi:antitoxin component YwqK of YwqJK toxin-antitoxin module
MRFFVFLAALLLNFNSFAQAPVNQLDDKGNKHGLWKGTYTESGRPRYEGTFEHGKETGTFKYFDDTKAGTVIATREFNLTDHSAYTIFYNQKGKKVSEGRVLNKKYEGEWKYYHENSDVVMTREFYKDGKLDGVRSVYFPDGKIAEETHYKNGLKHGPYKNYTTTGVALEEVTYVNGEIDGVGIYRDPNGAIASKGPYVNGLKKGVWEFYENGKLVRKEKHPLVKKFQKGTRK